MIDISISNVMEHLLEKNNGIVSTADIERAGISRTTLQQLVEKGELERVARGQYIRPNDVLDELFLLHKCSDKIVFSHETALFLLGMAERTPINHSFTVPRGTKLSNPIFDSCKRYYVKPELHGWGKCTVKSNMGHDVTTYNAERTICDILRSRSRIDDQTLAAAMKSLSSSANLNWRKLRDYAEAFHVTKLLRQYLEVLT